VKSWKPYKGYLSNQKGERKMDKAVEFKNIVAQYTEIAAEDMTDEMRFREDLGFSSLDFMSFLGELEDTFDVELEQEDALEVRTLGEALEMLDRLTEE
jgi:acyl carrier protein